MIKIKMSSENLKQLVDIINVYEVDAPIIFTEEEATVKMIDITRTAMIVAKIEKDVFSEYILDDDVEVICLPKDKINSILKTLKGEVTIEANGGWIIISSGKSVFKLHNVNYDEDLLKLDLKLSYDISFDMSAEQFKLAFDTTSLFDQYTVLKFDNKTVSFTSTSDTEGSASIVYAEDELNNVIGEGSAKSAFSSSYFKGIIKLKPNRFIVSLGESKPIKVIAPLMEGKCKCTAVVAPVILDE